MIISNFHMQGMHIQGETTKHEYQFPENLGIYEEKWKVSLSKKRSYVCVDKVNFSVMHNAHQRRKPQGAATLVRKTPDVALTRTTSGDIPTLISRNCTSREKKSDGLMMWQKQRLCQNPG